MKISTISCNLKSINKYLYLVLCSALLNSCASVKDTYYDKYWISVNNKADCEYYVKVEKTQDALSRIRYMRRYYYNNDTLYSEGMHKSPKEISEKVGKFTYYFKNGKKLEEVVYKDNKRDGESRRYYESGYLKSITDFVNDTIVKEKEFYEDGSLYETTEFKKGKIDGNHYSYYRNHQMIRSELWDEGKFQQGRCYTESGGDTAFYPQYIAASFPGGEKSLKKYLREEAKANHVEECLLSGYMLITATVDTSGNLIKPGFHFDTKNICLKFTAIRIFEHLPKWKPATTDKILCEERVALYVPLR